MSQTKGIICPKCGNAKFEVVYTRHGGGKIVRRRTCLKCRRRITTWEKQINLRPLTVYVLIFGWGYDEEVAGAYADEKLALRDAKKTPWARGGLIESKDDKGNRIWKCFKAKLPTFHIRPYEMVIS